MKEIRILNRTLDVEEIKDENNTQYRIWYRSFTNMLVSETISKDNVVVDYADHKAVVETMQKRIEGLEKENEYLKSCENCYPFLGSCFNCIRHENPRSKEKLIDNWTKK